jgi:hypothetical protein
VAKKQWVIIGFVRWQTWRQLLAGDTYLVWIPIVSFDNLVDCHNEERVLNLQNTDQKSGNPFQCFPDTFKTSPRPPDKEEER